MQLEYTGLDFVDTRIMLEEKSVVKAAEGITVADLNGEMILLDSNSGSYFGLNEVGASILKLLQEPKSYEELLEILGSEYDITPARLQEEVQHFLGELAELKLIDIECEHCH